MTDKSLFASERIKVIEFNRHFSPAEQDTHLKDELTSQEAMSGIFMWLVRGYIKYKEYGLTMSEPLRSVVAKYERDNDLVLQFLENRCVRVPEEEYNPLGEKNKWTTIRAKDLYQAFKYGRNLRVLMCSLRENSTQRWSVTPNGLTANQLPAVS